MDEKHVEHIDGIINRFSIFARQKYEQGVIEHGGYLWEKNCLVEAMKEAVDLVIYLDTELQKLETKIKKYANNNGDSPRE